MKVLYFSRSGRHVTKFIKRSGVEAESITEVDKVEEDYILVCSTYGHGEVPEPVLAFLAKWGQRIRGVAVSGNRIWGEDMYGRAGDIIAEKYNVPLLMKFEISGNNKDAQKFNELVTEIGGLN